LHDIRRYINYLKHYPSILLYNYFISFNLDEFLVLYFIFIILIIFLFVLDYENETIELFFINIKAILEAFVFWRTGFILLKLFLRFLIILFGLVHLQKFLVQKLRQIWYIFFLASLALKAKSVLFCFSFWLKIIQYVYKLAKLAQKHVINKLNLFVLLNNYDRFFKFVHDVLSFINLLNCPWYVSKYGTMHLSIYLLKLLLRQLLHCKRSMKTYLSKSKLLNRSLVAH
jgi:hypothetical protein